MSEFGGEVGNFQRCLVRKHKRCLVRIHQFEHFTIYEVQFRWNGNFWGKAESSADATTCSRANLRKADLRDSKRGGWHHDRGTNRQSRRLREERSLRAERRWRSSEDWTVDHRGGDSRSNGAGVG